MLNRIFISLFHRNRHTDIFAVWNLIFCVISQIPQFKFVGFENICFIFVGKFIILAAGGTELYIPGKIDA